MSTRPPTRPSAESPPAADPSGRAEDALAGVPGAPASAGAVPSPAHAHQAGGGAFLEAFRRGALAPPPIAVTLGLELRDLRPGHATFTLRTDPARDSNPQGTVQGGVLSALADAAMGYAYLTTLEAGESFTTVELKINFVRPVWRASLTAVGEVVQRGRTVGLVRCNVSDDEGRLIAFATSTCLTLAGERAAGR